MTTLQKAITKYIEHGYSPIPLVSGQKRPLLKDWTKYKDEVIEDLKENPVPEEELQKVKNQLRVEKIRFMDIMSGIGILFYLGQNAALGDWTEANNNPKMCDLVTAEDVQRVANEYFPDDQRNVMIINSKASPEGEEEEGEDPQFVQAMQMIKSATDVGRLEQMIGMFSMGMDKVEDPKEKAQMEELLKVASERLKELKEADEE